MRTFYCFEFRLMEFRADTDGTFMFQIGDWETADYNGSLLSIYRDFDGEWIFDFLCARTFIRMYLDWRDK